MTLANRAQLDIDDVLKAAGVGSHPMFPGGECTEEKRRVAYMLSGPVDICVRCGHMFSRP